MKGYQRNLKETYHPNLEKKYFSPSGNVKLYGHSTEMFKYTNPDGIDIPIDTGLPEPKITIITEEDIFYPTISIPKAFDEDSNQLLALFEFDISPNFDSPNYWRYPSLLPSKHKKDRGSRYGTDIGLSTSLEVGGFNSSMVFPFRATNMRLPLLEEELTSEELKKQAATLGLGLNNADLIKEVFHYVRYNYQWGDEDFSHSAYDTFKAGSGECGSVNNLAGLFFELNGIRSRGVAGFNPIARIVYPGGGHSSTEIWNEDERKWNYFDSYLNILLDDPVTEIKDHKDRNIKIYALDTNNPELKELGDYLSLEELFRFAVYYDKQGRLPAVAHHNILGISDQYGSYWDTVENVKNKYSINDLLPPNIKIYVRARYIDTNGVGLSNTAPLTGSFSNYSTTSFIVETKSITKVK